MLMKNISKIKRIQLRLSQIRALFLLQNAAIFRLTSAIRCASAFYDPHVIKAKNVLYAL